MAQTASSFGDWIGFVAILALVARITDNEFAVAAMLLARIAPALLFAPLAGVVIDRWNRKRLMVVCDLGRAALIATLPFIETVSRSLGGLHPVVLLFVVSALMEAFSLLWQPAKDAVVPEIVDRSRLTDANAMVLFAAYGTFPLGAGAFAALASVSTWLGKTFESFSEFELNQEHLAFFFDAFTFLVSAAIVATMALPHRAKRGQGRLDFSKVWEEFVEGLRAVREHPMIRPWVLGIGMIFVGIGGFLAIAYFYVQDVLGAGSAGFGLLLTSVGGGLGVGFLFAGVVARVIKRDVFFSLAVTGLGISMLGFGSVSTLTAGMIMGGSLGLFAGFSYPSGLTLMQEHAEEELRGRTLTAMHSVVRLGLVGALAGVPALARLIDINFDTSLWRFLGFEIAVTGARVSIWIAGIAIIAAAVVTTRAVAARREQDRRLPGLFIVFEGGEGAGKSTQILRLSSHLRSRGLDVLVTKEPGGTRLGHRIRQLLLDPETSMSPETEALLYAADRAQHVRELIRPALQNGGVVISDRFVDSSLAYQGFARELGVDRVYDLSWWATDGLLPDLVFLIDLEPSVGLQRSNSNDRIEQESPAFHKLVREAYHLLSKRFPNRFVVIDGAQSPEAVAEVVRQKLEPVLGMMNNNKVMV